MLERRLALSAVLLLTLAGLAHAQVADTDSDLVPDAFDNCTTVANGPGDPSNQVDTDQDGYGNACDADFDNDGVVAVSDYSLYRDNFNSAVALYDLTGDGYVTGDDWTTFIGLYNFAPGPSGLGCAGSVPCTP